MCGIVALHGAQERGWIEAMNARQVHRGPDDAGVFRDDENQLALAMRRLAIIDLDGGAQPMRSADGCHVLVYNGEIFNAPDLRADLEARGETFATDHSDTELLLRLLVRDGASCLPRLNGFFAFAFYDARERILLCARDRFGIKPLHYVAGNGRFAAASEIKSLLTLPFVSRELDPQALFDYLSLLYVAGERTAFAGIARVPAGGLVRYHLASRRLEIESWWRRRIVPDRATPAREWPGRIAEALDRAVKRWAWSDVPIAVSLSGGLDSSSIAGLSARNGVATQTFSLGFAGAEVASYNELPLARKVAEKWGLRHTEVVLEPAALLDDLPRMTAALDEPYGGGLPSWFVFQGMARQVKVALTGVGGDEMFGNYGKWLGLEGRWFERLARREITPERFRRRFFAAYYYAADQRKRALLTGDFGSAEDTAAMLFRRFEAAGDRGDGVRDSIALVDIETQLADEFLLMVDRFSMAHGLEARTPFLDNEFVDLVLSIPAAMRTRRRSLKGLLRQAVAPLLPPELHHAPKKGFVIPLGMWMRTRLRPLVRERLDEDRLRCQGVFQPRAVAELVAAHLDGRADHTQLLWALLMFQLWHDGIARA